MSDELLRSHDGPVTRLTLNRPQKANALSATLVEALLDAVEYAATDGTRLLILKGAGRHFCAGFDFGDLATLSDGDLALRFIRIEMLLQALHHAPHATLALAQGRVFGAGADLVACCGRRIATPDASFRMPGLRFGVVLGTRRLAAMIGTDRARDILGSSRAFDADEALACGFLTAVAPQDEWPAAAEAARIAALTLSPPAAAALLRRSQPDTRGEDMAELARSVAAPGLKERIRRYRESGS
ncbi:MAG: enoyl-CoA hydratase/isomerase family protein [Betaproteobacteria bacterium]|nr:enoyl-CoA hydratase/isomerase family protein [Betaproteobacteria bacterium]